VRARRRIAPARRGGARLCRDDKAVALVGRRVAECALTSALRRSSVKRCDGRGAEASRTGPGAASLTSVQDGTAGLGPSGGLSLLLVGSLVVLSTAVIAPALPAIEAHFRNDPRANYLVPLLVTAPALVIAMAAPFAGYVLDRFGRHQVVLTALVGFL